MKRIVRRLLAAIVCSSLLCTAVAPSVAFAAKSKKYNLSEEQKKSITMLNYLAYMTQRINASSNSRLLLEEAYSSLINNTLPHAVDETTQYQISTILQTIENYRMVDVKRERLQYLYEKSQAQAIRSAVPNPMGLLSAIGSFNLRKLAASITYMAIDSVTSYNAEKNSIDLQFLKDGWALDDEEAEALHTSRSETFSYMVDMTTSYDLPDELTLTEDTVNDFVKAQNNANNTQRKQFLLHGEDVYAAFGPYWLTLGETYYNENDYENALIAFSTYEEVEAPIFRHDHEFAKVIPLAIAAADEVLSGKKRVKTIQHYLELLDDNTTNEDWELKYFAAQTYIELYKTTENDEYLNTAYEITLNNVNYLTEEQERLNKTYILDVQKASDPEPVSKNASDERKKTYKQRKNDVKKYNQMLDKARAVELPPIYEPLLINCELLFALAEELGISDKDKLHIDGILRDENLDEKYDGRMFLVYPVDDHFSYEGSEMGTIDETLVGFTGDTLSIPALMVSDDAIIKVKLPSDTEDKIIDDWTIDKVERGNKNELDTFVAVYHSPSASKVKYKEGWIIEVEIIPSSEVNTNSFKYQFKAERKYDTWSWKKGFVENVFPEMSFSIASKDLEDN